jgi:hypothetical protein
MPGSQPLASNGGPAADLPGSWSPESLNDQLREPPRTLRRAPQKSHKSAIRTAPTDIPLTRTILPAATWTCTPARSASPGRAASPGPSGSATRRPAAWTATCAPAPGTPRRTGPSYGSA